VLGIKTIDEAALKHLRKAQRGNKHFTGSCNYEILSNIKYCSDFQYQSVDMRNEADDFETSDMITKALYLGDHFHYGNA